jgi:hypothetical protein
MANILTLDEVSRVRQYLDDDKFYGIPTSHQVMAIELNLPIPSVLRYCTEMERGNREINISPALVHDTARVSSEDEMGASTHQAGNSPPGLLMHGWLDKLFTSESTPTVTRIVMSAEKESKEDIPVPAADMSRSSVAVDKSAVLHNPRKTSNESVNVQPTQQQIQQCHYETLYARLQRFEETIVGEQQHLKTLIEGIQQRQRSFFETILGEQQQLKTLIEGIQQGQRSFVEDFGQEIQRSSVLSFFFLAPR